MDGNVIQNTAPAAPAPQETAAPVQNSVQESSQQQTNNEVNSTSTNTTVEQPQTFDTKGKWGMVVDKNTGLREIQFISDKPEKPKEDTVKKEYTVPDAAQPQPPTTNISDIVNQQQVQSVKPYTDNEFLLAMQMNSVDESRVPKQYQAQFALAKQQRLTTEKQAQTNTEVKPQEQTNPVADSKAYIEFYNRIGSMAQENAMKEIGITKEELDAADYSDDPELQAKYQAYKTAVNYHRSSIEYAIRSREEATKREAAEKQQAAERMRNDIATKVRELQGSEPNFTKIDLYMSTRYKTLPFEQARPVAEVYDILSKGGTPTPEQAQVLLKYYEDSRKDFYARNNNLATQPQPVAKPAVVENPGTGEAAPSSKPDFKALGKMDLDGKDAFIARLFGGK